MKLCIKEFYKNEIPKDFIVNWRSDHVIVIGKESEFVDWSDESTTPASGKYWSGWRYDLSFFSDYSVDDCCSLITDHIGFKAKEYKILFEIITKYREGCKCKDYSDSSVVWMV